jgi:hypothetical protein
VGGRRLTHIGSENGAYQEQSERGALKVVTSIHTDDCPYPADVRSCGGGPLVLQKRGLSSCRVSGTPEVG